MSENLYVCIKPTARLEIGELLIKLSSSIFYSARYNKNLELTKEEKDNIIRIADDPIDRLEAKIKELKEDKIPIGTLILVHATLDFKNYLYCDGRKISAKKYPKLHMILSNGRLPKQSELIQYWKKKNGNNYFVKAL